MRALPSMVSVFLLLITAVPAQEDLTAVVRPVREVTLRAGVDGSVAQVLVGIGDRVEKGQVLVELHAPRLRAQFEMARAELRHADLTRKAAELDVQIAERELEIARRQTKLDGDRLPATRERFQAAEEIFGRQKTLFEVGQITEADLSRAKVELSRAREEWDALGSHVKNLQERRELSELEVKRARLAQQRHEALCEGCRAVVEAAEIDLAATQIRSPFAGVVEQGSATIGQTVQAARTPLMKLIDTTKVHVRFAVAVPVAARLRAGQPVEVLRGDKGIEAKITRVDPNLHADSQTRGAVIELDNADGKWLPGARVVVRYPK